MVLSSQVAVPGQRAVAASNIRLFWQSTIGKKVVMAATGLIMVGFVIAHMLGNLQVFVGPERMNAYAAFLRSTGELLWVARAVLLAAVVLHIIAAVQLTRVDRAARVISYTRLEPQASTVASRTIRWGGLALALFIVFHLLHFTTGTIRPAPFSHTDVYANVIGGFRVWWVTAIYVLAMVALALHLYHGTWSSFRTLGLSRPSPSPFRRRAAAVVTLIVWLGFTVVPLAVFARLVR
jgi:succinate dehydrogenase / fumarate reductase cytochrome b subunit